MLVAAGAGVVVAGMVAGVWAWAREPPSRLKETRKPKMRFIKKNVKGESQASYGVSGHVVSGQCSNFKVFITNRALCTG